MVSDKERTRVKNHEYHLKHKEEIRNRSREYRARNRDRLLAQKRDYYAKNRNRLRNQNKAWRAKIRGRFFDLYGKECACCHEREEAFLTLGHIKNDGNVERRELGNWGIYAKAIEHPDLSRYETQCFNCNLGAKVNGGVCPHKSDKESDVQ